MKRNKIYFTILVLILIRFSACGEKLLIRQVLDNSEQFRNQQITLSGKVVETISIPLVNKGFFKMNDGTGEIWVRPVGNVPNKDEKVLITGTLKIGLTIADKNFGLILIEKGVEE